MKTLLQLLIFVILLIICELNLYAQYGNITAGGDATGTSGSMSYSIGQTDYLTYSSDQGSIGLGLQQVYFAMSPIYEIPSTIITDGDMLCFSAETLIVAGDGKHFLVEAGGHADLIAGSNIIIKPGTSVELHGSLHARISEDWCPPQQSLLASFSEPIPTQPLFEPEAHSTFFKVYPNPTTGCFTLEIMEFEEHSNIQLEIFTMQGHLILSNELPFEQRYILSLVERQPGIYLIRVLKDNNIGTAKIIKQ